VHACADEDFMTRSVGVVSLVVSLALAGWLVAAQMKREGPTAKAGSTAIAQANQAATTLTFQQAETALEQSRALNGTYAGADLAGFGVSLVRADATSYCVQAGQGAALSHENGPGGAPTAGPC
jgi:hypothetical protein